MKALFFSLSYLSLALLANAILPYNMECDLVQGSCRKGDFVAKHIADCKYDRTLEHPLSCDAMNDDLIEWTVDVAEGDRCKPITGRRVTCGAPGSNTRCVCSDVSPLDSITERGKFVPKFNECRCQYWPSHDEL